MLSFVDTSKTFQGCDKGTSSVTFGELIINCQACFVDLFSLNLLLLHVLSSFSKRYFFCRHKRMTVMDVRP